MIIKNKYASVALCKLTALSMYMYVHAVYIAAAVTVVLDLQLQYHICSWSSTAIQRR